MEKIKKYQLEASLCNRTTLRFDFIHSCMVCAQTSALLVQG